MLLLLKSEADCLARQHWQITHAWGVRHAVPLNAQRTTARAVSFTGRHRRSIRLRLRTGSSSMAVVLFPLCSRRQKEYLVIADFEQDNEAGLPERNDELAPSGRRFATPASVWGEGKNIEAAIHCGDEARRNRLIGKLRPQLAFNEEVLQALDVSLVPRCGGEVEGTQAARAREATAARMRSAPLVARCRIRACTSASVGPPRSSCSVSAAWARATNAACAARHSTSLRTASSMNCVRLSPSRSTASVWARISGSTRIGGKVEVRMAS
jgi:hypothetical protein